MSETIPSPTDIGALANRINLHTRDAHNKIDKAMSINIAFALRHRFIYEDIIKTYFEIFSKIEDKIDSIMATDTPTSKILHSFYMDEFRRKPQLLKDLNILRIDPNYVNTTWLQTRPNLQTFLNFIDTETDKDPITILAYCHVLYLALFAGGRVIRSTLYKNLGFLPNFDHLTKEQMIEKGTNFFRFAKTTDEENKLRWKYKKNYELNTRTQLTEEQKLTVINTASEIFNLNTACLFEIKDINKKELMTKFDFKFLTFLIEEWKFNNTVISQKSKKNILFGIAFIQSLLIYFFIKKIIFNYFT